MADLADLRNDLSRLLADTTPLQHAVGMFGKETANDVIADALGADQRFSGLRRKVKLGAGYDIGNPVVLNLRPAGLWFLADAGRKRTKRITPRRRGGKQALLTPHGPRAWSTSGRSSGHRVLVKTQSRIEQDIVTAAEEGVNDMIRKVFP